jgi:hypothetical protein
VRLLAAGQFRRTFRFEGCIVDRVNLREGWSGPIPGPSFRPLTEDQKKDGGHFDRVQMMAEDYLRMGMARTQKVNLPEPYKLDELSRAKSWSSAAASPAWRGSGCGQGGL